MRIRFYSVAGLLIALVSVFLIICAIPNPPPGPEQAEVELFLRSSTGHESTTSITDTVGNFDTIGVVLYLTQHIDSTEIMVTSGDSVEYHFITKAKKTEVDTIFYAVHFPSPGERSVIATGYINGYRNSEANVIIHVISRPGENYPPALKISGWPIIQAGDSVLLTVGATDPDEDQEITIETLRIPDGANYESGKFVWETTTDDIGTDTVIFIATDDGEPAMADTDTVVITVSADPVNQPPVLSFEGRHTVVAGEDLAIAVSATDPDDAQTVSIEALRFPDGATFENDTLRWTPSEENIGNDTAIFVATDDGDPVLADTDTVVITVTETLTNESPEWSEEDTLRLEGKSGVELSQDLADICSDADGDAITFTLIPDEAPEGDSINESTWSYTPSDDDIGTTYLQIVASDAYDGTDTMIVELTVTGTVTTEDLQPPAMALVTPAGDSQSVASDEYEVTISCSDTSGVASVLCVMGEDTFEVTVSEDTLYSAMITGLASSEWSTVAFIATDSAPAENSDTLSVTLMYDPEATDENPPSIRLVSPSADTVVDADTCVIRVRVTDESGVASVTIGGVDADGEDDDIFVATVRDLTGGEYTTITIVATDSAETPHTDSTSVQVKYDDDQTGPEFTLVTPENDSVTTGSDVYTVTVACTDPSGVTSVVAEMGGGSFTGEHISDDRWDIEITGLAEGEFNEVTITATDGSLRENNSIDTVYLKFEVVKRYTVTFDKNDVVATGTMTPQSIEADSAVVLKANAFEKDGSVFAGWSTDPSGDVEYENEASFTMGTEDVILYAQWNVLSTFTVIYDGNENTSGSVPADQIKTEGITLTIALNTGNLIRTGYSFVGWNTEADGSGTDYAQGADFTIDADVTLYAQWTTKPIYTVSYGGNGNTGGTAPSDQTKIEGISLTLSSNSGNLSRSNYSFTGWNTAADGSGTEYGEGDSYTTDADVTLYAQWTALPTYTVSYDGNGNTGGTAPSDQTKIEGISLTLSSNSGNLSRSNYSFTGWNTAADGSGTDYGEGDSYTTDADVTLYAQWTALPTYTVSYDGNGNTAGTAPSDQTKIEGVSLTLSSNSGNLSRSNYSFTGWNTEADGSGTEYGEGDSYTTDADVTLYAQWTALPTYTVSYDGNGNTAGTAPSDQTKIEGVSLTLSSNSGNLSRSNYSFTGWNTEADGSGTEYGEGDSYTTDADVTLYAQWTALPTYTVSYDGNGNTAGTAPSDQTKIEGISLTLSSNSGNLTRSGYNFTGWNTEADGSGTEYGEGGSYTTDADVTLYAQWDIIRYSISYISNGGDDGGNPSTYTITETPIMLSAASKACNSFGGWFNNPGLTGTPVTSIPLNSTGDKEFYAKWTADAPFGVTIIGSPGTICPGADVTLSVSGSYATYQWYHGTQQLTTQASLTLNDVTTADGGTYTCNVTNSSGCSGSGSASLTVGVSPADPIIEQPDAICQGGTVNLNLCVTNTPGNGGSWVWYESNQSTKLSSSIVSPVSNKTYWVHSEGGTCGESGWNSVDVSVNAISQAPTGINVSENPVCPNGTTRLTVQGGALGDGASWEWSSKSDFSDNVGTGSPIDVQITKNTTYYVRAEGACNGPTAYAYLAVSMVTPINITGPASETQCDQLWQTFDVTASGGGTGNLYYQWKRNGVPVSDGANYRNTNSKTLSVLTSVYTIGDFTCTVDNGNGCSETSSTATLSIEYSPLTVTAPDPNNWDVCVGGLIGFDVTVSGGSGNYYYQWYKDDVPLSADPSHSIDPTSRSLYVSPVRTSDAGKYHCVVNDLDNLGCPLKSQTGTVTVKSTCP